LIIIVLLGSLSKTYTDFFFSEVISKSEPATAIALGKNRLSRGPSVM